MKTLTKAAICYDVDDTLALGNMQEYGLVKALKTTPKSFWNKSDGLADSQGVDKNLAYMYTMLEEAKRRHITLHKDDMADFGVDIPLFNGVSDWFDRINAYALERGIELQHFVLSSGLKEIIQGMPIAQKFTKIYACSFMYNSQGEIIWPAQVVNYTTKTQYLFRISKGCLDETDMAVNERTPHTERNILFNNMMYIGDGLTDIPCMATLRKFGGSAIAVYRPRGQNSNKKALKLLHDGRVDNIAPADYSPDLKLDSLVKAWINRIKANIDFKL